MRSRLEAFADRLAVSLLDVREKSRERLRVTIRNIIEREVRSFVHSLWPKGSATLERPEA